MRQRLIRASAIVLVAATSGCAEAAPTPSAADGKPFVTTKIADLDSPWAMTFLPDGRMLVTEKAGKLMLGSADGKSWHEVAGIPRVDSAGQGSLMDVVLAPDFVTSRMVYFSFSAAGAGGNGVVLARGRLSDSADRLDCSAHAAGPAPTRSRSARSRRSLGAHLCGTGDGASSGSGRERKRRRQADTSNGRGPRGVQGARAP